jgi:hypothetical protein
MTEPIEIIRGDEIGFCFTIEPGLEEDQVWRAAALPLLEGLPANSIDIWQYCVTEMVNNAIDQFRGFGADGGGRKATFENPGAGAR